MQIVNLFTQSASQYYGVALTSFQHDLTFEQREVQMSITSQIVETSMEMEKWFATKFKVEENDQRKVHFKNALFLNRRIDAGSRATQQDSAAA